MKINKRKIKIITVVVMTVIVVIGCMCCFAYSRIVPSHAVEREAIHGEIIHIDGFDIWSNLINGESDNTPIIVIAGGSGLSSDYLEDSLHFLSKNHPLLFYDARGCGRSQIKSNLSNYSVSKFADE